MAFDAVGPKREGDAAVLAGGIMNRIVEDGACRCRVAGEPAEHITDLPRRAQMDGDMVLAGEQAGASEPLAAVIDNISTGGLELLFAKAHVLPIGQVLSIAFQVLLDDRKYLIECEAEVVSKPRDSGSNAFAYGFALKSLTDEQFAVVHAYVADRLANRLGPRIYANP